LKNAFVRIKKALSSYIYIYREREATGTIWERERSGKTTRVASSCVVVVVEKEVHQSEPEKSIGERKRYKRVNREL